MPVIKSAIKQVRMSAKRHIRNQSTRSRLHSSVKKLRTLISQKKKAEAMKFLPAVYRDLDVAAKKNVIQKNTASRKKSRLASQVAALK